MSLTQALREEILAVPEGVYAPHCFKFRAIREEPDAAPQRIRANMIRALFSEPKPRILPHDLIAGNTHCLFALEEEAYLAYAERIVNMLGRRKFKTNADHYAPDYRVILSKGVPGLIDDVDRSLERHAHDGKRVETLKDMRITLEGFSAMIAHYADAADALAADPAYDGERLAFIRGNCRALVSGAPRHFAEALQLVWFCHTAFRMEGRSAMALARIDQYLWPFYKKDVEDGILTRSRAVELLETVFIKIVNDTVNICVGGPSPDGSCDVNELSYCVVEAVKNCRVPGPKHSARIMPGTPDDFLLKCLESIGTGLGYPALMNDEVNIPGLSRYGYAREDVYNYSMVGCIENFITGKQPPWVDSRFNTPLYLDYVFNNGVSQTCGSFGLALGEAESITTMDQFMKNFEAQLAWGVSEHCLDIHSRTDMLSQEAVNEPFLSCFCHDCIGRGLDINNGGSLYPSVHGAAVMGIGTVADSLAAVEKVVFTDHDATLAELRDALNANFEGYEELREKLLAAPKYGNGDDFVDKYAVWFLDYINACFSRHHTRDGGPYYVLMAANISNISAGASDNATPDGRLRGESLSDAASPTHGRDHLGATVALRSVSKPDYTKSAGGTVVNQKFSPSAFEGDHLRALAALVRVYFKNGGQELQMNATSREVLVDAMEHPEKYGDLVVRVSGFSAYYVTLGRDVQYDILSRSQQE